MQKSLFILFLVALCATRVSAQSSDTLFFNFLNEPCEKENASYFHPPSRKVEQGWLFKDYYMSGQLRSEGISLKPDGEVWNGEVVFYNESGLLSSREPYKNGLRHGSSREYDYQGNVIKEVNFREGVLHGPIHVAGSYDGEYKEGKKDGHWQLYYTPGEPKEEYTLTNGKLQGKYLEYDYDGQLIAEGEFDQGKPVSFLTTDEYGGCVWKFKEETREGIEHWTIWREGKKVIESKFRDGKRTGTWKAWAADGETLFMQASYDPDYEPDPYWGEYSFGPGEIQPASFPLPDRFYEVHRMGKGEEGCLHGEFTEFDAKGEVVFQAQFEQGKQIGEAIEGDPNSLSAMEAPWKMDCFGHAEEEVDEAYNREAHPAQGTQECFKSLYAEMDTVISKLPADQLEGAWKKAKPGAHQFMVFMDEDPTSQKVKFRLGDKIKSELQQKIMAPLSLSVCLLEVYPNRDWASEAIWDEMEAAIGED